MQDILRIPYFTTSRYKVMTMVELAQPKSYELGADLGAGDGRITIAFAKAGVTMHGFEIDEDLKRVAEQNIADESFGFAQDKHIMNATIYKRDFWQEDLSKYTIVCCYPMPTIMGRLEKKLKDELKPGARVLLNYFPFLHWKELALKDTIYLYKK